MSDLATRVAAPGLSQVEAAKRLAAHGRNELPRPERPSALRRFLHQLVHFFALMLWVAAVLAFLARMPQLGIAIALVIVLNALFSFAQERRADRAADRLQDLLPRRITVRRDSRSVQIEASEVVPDDVLLLEPGDRIPADGVVSIGRGLQIDASMLTGESEAVLAVEGAAVRAGTFVVEGEAEALVTATGGDTELAAIARMTTATKHAASPLTLELGNLVRTIATIAVVTGVVFFGLALLLGNPLSEGFTFAIGVTVALVPEALLPTVTLSLAWGAEQMAKRQVLVRSLDAVETLGSTTFICTDKTGTLTKNEMTVVEVWVPGGYATAAEPGYSPEGAVTISDASAREAVMRLAQAAVHCSAGYAYRDGPIWRAHGDPMEAAIDVFARRLGLPTHAGVHDGAVVDRFPFDPRRRRMSVVTRDAILVKGAPDAVLPLCTSGADAQEQLRVLTDRGLRVLAVAGRATEGAMPETDADAERDLTLFGLLALEDPPRIDAAEAIASCRSAGMRVAMVTGDHPTTARTIATEVGLRTPDGVVLTGDDLDDDDEVLAEQVDRDGVVIARVSPEQKLRIARALRSRGHVVAMTGDGVNDGPALREANIGIAMGASGTDVAREAADLVLLDDNFATIVAGIEQGRSTFLNVRRFLTYHLTDNVAELTPFVVWALSGGRIPLALGVLQILALDIGTDTLSATALGAEPPAPHTLERPPVSGRLMNRTVIRRAFGTLGPTIAVGTMTAFFVTFLMAGWRPGESFPSDVLPAASGAAFMTVVIAQTANAWACRSTTKWPGALGWASNPLLVIGASIEVLFSLVVLFVPLFARELGHESPPLGGWLVGFATAGAVLLVDGMLKARKARRLRRAGTVVLP